MAAFASTPNPAQGQAPSDVTFAVSGPEETIFQWKTQRCDGGDVPDAAARAFRDADRKVHLIASYYLNRAMVGPDLGHVTKDCRVIYRGGESRVPGDFDDRGWLESFYTQNGRNISALVSMDFHPDRHGDRCGNPAVNKDQCWYSTIVFAQSADGGRTFKSPPPGDARLVAGDADPFNPDAITTVGALVPSNIISFQGHFYILVSFASSKQQKGGECLLRSAKFDDPKGWRGWDGKEFSVGFHSPYDKTVTERSHCQPLHDLAIAPVRSLLIFRDLFLALSFRPEDKAHALPSAVVAQFSTDLLNWSAPVVVMELPMYRPYAGAKGEAAFYYPSLLDPASPSVNFETIGNKPYLYLTKYRYGEGNNRDLVRYSLRISAP